MSESRSPSSRQPRQQRRAQERKLRKAGKAQAALTLGAAALAAAPGAQAATFTVTNLNDSGAGSLRQAILDANGAAGADVVDFQAGLTGTITLTTGQLSIYDSVDVQGPGASVLTVSGNNADRVFYLYANAATIDVTLSGLTITGGNANIGGGVVDFDENLTLDSVVITGNAATGDGGGVWADGFNMNLTIQNSTVSGNTSGDDGGGMYVEDTGGPLNIQNSIFSGNDATDKGGGIYFYDPDDDVNIVDSTISGNSAGTLGGGIYLYSPDDGILTISRTTISGNDAQAGGGLFLYSPDHEGSIENSTISGNQATAGDGGGIYLYNLYNFQIRHTTIAGNTASGTGGGIFSNNSELPLSHVIVGDNTAGTNNDLGNGAEGAFLVEFSLIESPGTASITDNGGNILSQDPQLSALADHGGPTETHLPASTSPAVNAGDPAFVPPPSTDQRGLARVVNGRIDMGAVEINPGTIELTFSAANVAESAGTIAITATRTGGFDGPVSVTLNTADGTATAPADYAALVNSLLNWADGDTAPKSINVTIVNDTLDEPDETFTATISNPTGGAALGGTVTATITIQDDDVLAPPDVIEVPTVGDVGRVLLTA
ncbi:MAG: choice-of-anchor Q domain-containing protein, partial [Acidobacteriota bacterium]